MADLSLKYLKVLRGIPERIQVDNGSEVVSKALGLRAYDKQVVEDVWSVIRPRQQLRPSRGTTAYPTTIEYDNNKYDVMSFAFRRLVEAGSFEADACSASVTVKRGSRTHYP